MRSVQEKTELFSVSLTITLPLFLMAGLLYGCQDSDGKKMTPAAIDLGKTTVAKDSPLLPLPPAPLLSSERVALGRQLFHDTRLSHDDSIACASCHALDTGGVDKKRVSVGIEGRPGVINAPTVFNAGFNFVQFWNGRAGTLEEQVAGPIHNPVEMGSNWNEVVEKLAADAGYVAQFKTVYRDEITPTNIADAIATFERSLVTPNSRFDRFLLGEAGALDEDAERGYHLFVNYGCSSCHQGVGIGGNMFQKFGVMNDPFEGRTPGEADLGRFTVTKQDDDRQVFKVPSLRNVAVTAPYFHDGSAATLEEAVIAMGKYQLAKKLSNKDVRQITVFLKSLTGEWEGRVLK
jgi:cytochrome c peroxidase